MSLGWWYWWPQEGDWFESNFDKDNDAIEIPEWSTSEESGESDPELVLCRIRMFFSLKVF